MFACGAGADERTGGFEPVQVLSQSSEADLDEAELELHHREDMLHAGAGFALDPVLPLAFRVGLQLGLPEPVDAADGFGRVFGEHRLLALIGLIAPYLSLMAMQQRRQHLAVGRVGCRGGDRVDQLRLGIDAHVGIHAEVPLLALAHLVHLRVALAALVIGRRRRMQDGRIDDGARADLQPMLLQVAVHLGEDALAQFVPLEQMTELAHRRLVRRRLAAKIDAHEAAHRRRFIQSVLDRRVGQVEPLLQKVNPQHPLDAHRRTALAGVRIVWLHQRHQLGPRNHHLHLRKKLRSTRLPPKPLKSSRYRQRLLLHPNHLTFTT